MTDRLSVVVLAAGLGTRMRSRTPKHLHPVLGRRMVDWVLAAVRPLGPTPLVVVAAPETAGAFGEDVRVAVQQRPLGTGDAARVGAGALDEEDGDVVIVSGDTPLLTSELLAGLVDSHRQAGAAATVLAAEPADRRAYGRVLRRPDGSLEAIVEASDATPEQLAVPEVNTSIYVFRGEALRTALQHLDARNAQGELYLTDTVGHLASAGELVAVERVADAEIGPDALVGPFCYLRPQTSLAARAKAGTFVEMKNSRIGEGAKVPHLSYLGDAEVGAGTNVGAGGVTVNFPHRPGPKGRTTIGRNVRTGVHNAFVAPVTIGDDAWIAAGSVITDDVPAGSLAGFPPRQVTKEGYVYRESDSSD